MIIIINDKLCAPRLFSLADALNSMEDRHDSNYSNALRNNRRGAISAKCKRLGSIYISERVTKHTGIDHVAMHARLNIACDVRID